MVFAELMIGRAKEAKLKTVFRRGLKRRPEKKTKERNDVMKKCEYLKTSDG